MGDHRRDRKKSPPSPPPSLADLPDGILTDILSRLPVESVFVSRCVCRTFLNLTTPHQNPSFPKLHFSRQSRPHILIQSGPTRLHLLDTRLLTAAAAADDEAIPIKPKLFLPPSEKRNRSYVIAGSCNGLICLGKAGGNPRVVCNPITNEYTVIPKPDDKPSIMLDYGDGAGPQLVTPKSFHIGSALGYCPVTDSFKVLRMVGTSFFEIHVLGTNSWRHVECATHVLANYSSGRSPFFHNGYLHWDCCEHGIVSLSFTTETFGKLSLPKRFLETDIVSWLVCVFEGCLSVFASQMEGYEIWVMKEYGVQESWAKQFVINYREHCYFHYKNYEPFDCLISGGELLMVRGYDCSLGCYDIRDKSSRLFQVQRKRLNYEVYYHTPSFASLKEVIGAERVKVLDVHSRTDQIAGEEALVLMEVGHLKGGIGN